MSIQWIRILAHFRLMAKRFREALTACRSPRFWNSIVCTYVSTVPKISFLTITSIISSCLRRKTRQLISGWSLAVTFKEWWLNLRPPNVACEGYKQMWLTAATNNCHCVLEQLMHVARSASEWHWPARSASFTRTASATPLYRSLQRFFWLYQMNVSLGSSFLAHTSTTCCWNRRQLLSTTFRPSLCINL